MTSGIGYLAAFLGGLLALLSPCSALLLPAFFAYSIDTRAKLVARTGILYAGLATTLVPLGAAGSLAGRFFYGHRDLLVTAGGWLIIGLGVLQVLGLGFASRRAAEASGRIRPTSALSVYALGLVYGLAGFCAGPILGSVLTVAALSGSPAYGGLLLAVYALGMAVPLFVLALLWERYDLGRRGWLRGRPIRLGRLRVHSTSLLSGLFFIALGTLFTAGPPHRRRVLRPGSPSRLPRPHHPGLGAAHRRRGRRRPRAHGAGQAGEPDAGTRGDVTDTGEGRRLLPRTGASGARPVPFAGPGSRVSGPGSRVPGLGTRVFGKRRRPRSFERGLLLVAGAGVEPATYRFSGDRSYQLSYPATRDCFQSPRT